MIDDTTTTSKPQPRRESHILNVSVRGIITMTVVATICYMGLRMIEVKEPLYSISFLCLGYYFGQGTKPTQKTTV